MNHVCENVSIGIPKRSFVTVSGHGDMEPETGKFFLITHRDVNCVAVRYF